MSSMRCGLSFARRFSIPNLSKTQLNQAEGQDFGDDSANNYYEGVTQAEAEDFYRAMADPADPEPVSYGLEFEAREG